MTLRPFESRGFSLVELLVALAVCAVLSATVAGVVPPARAAFAAAPAALDLQQRGRTGVDVLATAIRSAAAGLLPAVIPLSPFSDANETEFDAWYVVAPVSNASQGVLARDQVGPHGAIELAAGAGCPAVPDVCGFTPGAFAAIADGSGRFDIFTVATTNAAGGEITATQAFPSAYPAGSLVVEVDAHQFRLADQSDGSHALVRETVGGATQPIVDNVAAMGIELWRGVAPIRLSAGDLEDGPFFAGGPEGSYDADLLAVRRVDVWIAVEVPPVMLRAPGAATTRTLHASIALRNVASRNVP
ncbi:MAG: prepilin-type N-terminal cleavage/methylation domain-containing protein [Acidobacteriota bacterium]|nr:prepilin-type N-terminal cleavage/methylation domain-containing protein [Acidobacteriota bacterium]